MWPVQREAKPPLKHFRGATAPIAPPSLILHTGMGSDPAYCICRGEGGSGPPTVNREYMHRVIPRLSATNKVALFLFLPSVAKSQEKRLLDMPS